MAKPKKNKFITVKFDAPVTLGFALAAVAAFIASAAAKSCGTTALARFFSAPSFTPHAVSFRWNSVQDYFRLFTHVLGHRTWEHLAENLAFILLLGAQLEKTYGAKLMGLMFAVCAFVSGVLSVCFIPAGLQGANGIAFMLIVLAVYSTIKKQELPLTSGLLLLVYIARSVAGTDGGYAEIAHIAGGLCAALFGMIPPEKARGGKKQAKSSINNSAGGETDSSAGAEP